MLAHRRLVRRRVDAERPDIAGLVDHHVAVLPRDVREVVRRDLLGTPADLLHLRLGDEEGPFDQEARHRILHKLCALAAVSLACRGERVTVSDMSTSRHRAPRWSPEAILRTIRDD